MGAIGDIVKVVDETAKKTYKHVKFGKDVITSTNSSLVKMTKPARVEPLCVIDSDCIQLSYISDVVQCLQSIFTGYYLQAVSLLGTVSGVAVIGDLDRLNPHREFSIPDIIESTLTDRYGSYESVHLSSENYKWSLPMTGEIALEGGFNKRSRKQRYNKKPVDKPVDNEPPVKNKNKFNIYDDRGNFKIDDAIEKMANLSIGKVFNVTIDRDGQSITVPITVRLLVNELPPNILIKMFGNDKMDTSFVERYYKWKAGRISFFSDLILCRDLVKAHKKELMQDENKVISEITRRANDNLAMSLYSRKPSLATASNLYIISTDTATAIKRVSGLDITKYNQREQIFNTTYAMILCVIDRDYERISFYHDGVAMPTTLSARDLRGVNKNAEPTIMDVLSAYKQGQSPVL